MLIQYSVENYKSIRDEIVINFRAKGKKRDDSWVADRYRDNLGLYKCIGLVGPNASGKTNIIESLLFALNFIRGTVSRREDAPINIDTFWLGGEECLNAPGSFEFIFFSNGMKYVYGFSVTKTEVTEEYLLGYFTSKAKTIFDRSEGQVYNFKGNDVRTQTEISRKTNKNRLYMPVAAEWGYEPAKIVYKWFNHVSRQYRNHMKNMIEEIIRNEKRKELLLCELCKADFNIRDLYIKNTRMSEKDRDIVKRVLAVLGETDDLNVPENRPEIRIVHGNSSGARMDMSLDEDSAGTSMIVQNIAELMYLGEEGGLMLEDELGKAYHTRLTRHFLDMVKYPDRNTGDVQLLFSSHDTKILNYLNPDQIYLVDKDEEGVTRVKLLDDYDLKKNEDIELGYLRGRFGSVPYMRG